MSTATCIAVRLPPGKERQWKAEAAQKWESGFLNMWQKDQAAKAIRNPCRQMLNEESGAPEVNLLLQGHYYGTTDLRPRKRAVTPNIIRRNKGLCSSGGKFALRGSSSAKSRTRAHSVADFRAVRSFDDLAAQAPKAEDPQYREHMLLNRKRKLNLYGNNRAVTAADCVIHYRPERAATPPPTFAADHEAVAPRIISSSHGVATPWAGSRRQPPRSPEYRETDAVEPSPAVYADRFADRQVAEAAPPRQYETARAPSVMSDVSLHESELSSRPPSRSSTGSKVPLMAMKYAAAAKANPPNRHATLDADNEHVVAAVGTAQRGIKALRQVPAAYTSSVNPVPKVSVAHNHLTTFRKEGGVVVADHSEHRRVPLSHGLPVSADQRSPVYWYSAEGLPPPM